MASYPSYDLRMSPSPYVWESGKGWTLSRESFDLGRCSVMGVDKNSVLREWKSTNWISFGYITQADLDTYPEAKVAFSIVTSELYKLMNKKD